MRSVLPPIFVATHPRACSTAFERVFMTRRQELECVHEPFGDAYYYGPERMAERYRDDESSREKSGFKDVTFGDVVDRIEDAGKEGKRIFIKDMGYYMVPPAGQDARVAPSLGAPEPGNPTALPEATLARFQFAFLIRHPRRAIPSYYRCTIPPLSATTGFDGFLASEAGYRELRALFDFVLARGIVDRSRLVVVDADGLLDDPTGTVERFCKGVGLDYQPSMLQWSDEDKAYAEDLFRKWPGFHDDALTSTSLRARSHAHKTATVESEDQEWKEKYGEEGQRRIRQCVDANIADYEYLRSFAINV